MGGTNLELAKAVVAAAGKDCRVTIAGGVTTAEEIRALDEIGADAQVGMALYTGRLDLADAIMAPLVTDRPDGLYPTVVVDERGVCLGLVYSSQESIREAVRRRMGIYQSRRRGLWVKGETSGATQELLRIDLDCDRDSPRFVVRQTGPGFCHLDTRTCWGEDAGLGRLARTLAERREQRAAGQLHGQAVRRPGAARRQAARGGGRAGRGQRPRARDLGGRRRALLHAGPARARGHRPGRGRGASRPARAQGDPARMRLAASAGPALLAPVHGAARSWSRCCSLAAGLWGFLELADEIREGEQFRLDRTILLLFRNPADPSDPIGPVWLEVGGARRDGARRHRGDHHRHAERGGLPAAVRQARRGPVRRRRDRRRRAAQLRRSRPASSGRAPTCSRTARRSTRRASRAATPPVPPPPT